MSGQKCINNKNKKKGPKINDKDVVGPWDADQSLYFLKL
jgi:hypothetical protein